jgi:excisionase family DNA binding protein
MGHSNTMAEWKVLLRDHHPGYISWEQYEANQTLISENAHMLPPDRKSARGGRALLTGLVRCGRCGRTMRVFYGTTSGHAHRYQCRGDDSHVGGWLCTGVGGVRIDRAVVEQIVEAVSEHAIEAAIQAADQSAKVDNEVRQALCRELEEARYEASLAARRYELVDPAKRLVARELETRWNATLERVADLEDRIAQHDAAVARSPKVDRAALMALARDLPATWNAPGTDPRTKQRITHILIREVVLDRDDATNEAIVAIHWNGGRHTELRVSRVRTGRYPADRQPSPVEVIRRLGGQWPDREVAVTMNRMRCKPADGKSWTAVRVRELRERLGIAPFDPALPRVETVTVDEAAARLGICVRSVHKLIRKGVLPATQLMHSAPWQIPVEALETEAVTTGVRYIVGRRPKFYKRFQDDKTIQLPGL